MTHSAHPAFSATIFHNETPVSCWEGLSKREFFAALALQGLLASTSWRLDEELRFFEHQAPSSQSLAEIAVEQADELIKQLNNR